MSFRTLDVYQVAVRFLPVAAPIADSLPSRYAGLADQLRRASISIPLNIAEGSGKSSGPDQRRFYARARGSAMECAVILDASVARDLVGAGQNGEAEQLLGRPVKMLSKMCRVLSTSGEG